MSSLREGRRIFSLCLSLYRIALGKCFRFPSVNVPIIIQQFIIKHNPLLLAKGCVFLGLRI